MRGVTPKNARCPPQKCEVSSPKMRGVTSKNARCHPKNARCHPQKYEVSAPKMRGVSPKGVKMRGVSPKNARCQPQKCEVSPPKMRGVTPKNARCHPQKCEVSPLKMRGVTPIPQKMRGVTPTSASSHPENGEMAPHQFFKNNFSRSKPAKGTHCAWRSYGALPSLKNRRFQLLLFFCYLKCGENARSHPDRRYRLARLGSQYFSDHFQSIKLFQFFFPILPIIRVG